MKLLFVCKSNIGRSQSAEFFFNKHSKNNTAMSAGINEIKKGEEVIKNIPSAQKAIEGLQKHGFDISEKTRQQLTESLFKDADKVYVLMEESEKVVPAYLKNNPKVIFHGFQNTKDIGGKERDKITEEIKKFAENLAESLD